MTDQPIENTVVRSFHYKDGWHFTRLADGQVLISHEGPNQPADFELCIDPDGWCSAVAAVSREGETSLTWRLMQALHSNRT